jgi:hypothetical protein
MAQELKNEIENRALKDLEYISNYKPIAPEAKSAQHFSKMTIIKPIAINVYPQIYIDLVKQFDQTEVTRRLKNLGLRVAKFYYSVFPEMLQKSQTFPEIFTEVAQTHLHEQLTFTNRVKENKRLISCTIKVKECFFCSGITLIENIPIPYCIPVAGLYENLYNLKSLYNNNMEPRLVTIDATKSAEFEGDVCEYQVTVID